MSRKSAIFLGVFLVILVVGLLSWALAYQGLPGSQRTPTLTPTPKAAQPTSTADLQKQIDRLNQRIKDLEGRVGARYDASSLENRVSALEEKVGGQFLGGGLSQLESRVNSLESTVGRSQGIASPLGNRIDQLERRVSALESKSGGSLFR